MLHRISKPYKSSRLHTKGVIFQLCFQKSRYLVAADERGGPNFSGDAKVLLEDVERRDIECCAQLCDLAALSMHWVAMTGT